MYERFIDGDYSNFFFNSDKPRFKGDETVYVIPGNDLDVKCTFKANPKPTVSWADEVRL